jgi:hypothetical protein
MKLNVLVLCVVGILAYLQYTRYEEPVPVKSAELLEFIESCEQQGLIVTEIDAVTVSCAPPK